jgi:predicted nucleic acid-binding protein
MPGSSTAIGAGGAPSATPLLADASALVAYLAPGQAAHGDVAGFLATVRSGLATTGPAFTEAMHLMRRVRGYQGQQALWALRRSGLLEIADSDWDRSEALMNQYRDTPMDLADATLVSLAEARNQRTILTLDGDFLVYRVRRGRRHLPFRVVPNTAG